MDITMRRSIFSGRLVCRLIKVALVLVLLALLELALQHNDLGLLTPDDNASGKEREISGRTRSTNLEGSDCQLIHLCTVSTTLEMTHDAISMFRSVLHFRPRGPFQLHLGVNNHTHVIWKTLLDTWQLKQVSVSFYNMESEKLADMIDVLMEDPQAVDASNVLLLGPKLRVFEDLENLWKLFKNYMDQIIGISSSQTKTMTWEELSTQDLILFNVAKARHLALGLWKMARSNGVHADDIFPVPSTWGVRADSQGPIPPDTSAIIIDSKTMTSYSKDARLRNKLELLAALEKEDGLIYSLAEDVCTINSYQQRIAQTKNNSWIEPMCQEFVDFPDYPKRTQLYFAGHIPVSTTRFSVSLLTQLSLDRWSFLDQTLERWSGPLHAVLYLTDAEAQQLRVMYKGSKFSSRSNIALHVVYKRKNFYNMDHLRNLLLDVATTPYVFIVDADFIPSADLEDKLKQHIETSLDGKPRRALIVPGFEVLGGASIPHNKAELLEQYDKTIVGFHQRFYPPAHKPTNFPKWVKANDPYTITYHTEFEPYVVLPKENAPRYHEMLLERMQNKIAYTLQLYAMGYVFVVLPDVFVVHMPHPKPNTMKIHKGYGKCGVMIFRKYVGELKKLYPAAQIQYPG